MPKQVKIHYLEMLSPAQLNEKLCNDPHLIIARDATGDPQLNKSLYKLVGADWQWTEKLPWSDDQWRAYVEDDNLKTFVAYCNDDIAGYYELLAHPDQSVEINYFGLAPDHIGKGRGAHLLTHAVRSAWACHAKRVWLHTCTLDHPYALKNYLARGFKLYKTESATHPT